MKETKSDLIIGILEEITSQLNNDLIPHACRCGNNGGGDCAQCHAANRIFDGIIDMIDLVKDVAIENTRLTKALLSSMEQLIDFTMPPDVEPLPIPDEFTAPDNGWLYNDDDEPEVVGGI